MLTRRHFMTAAAAVATFDSSRFGSAALAQGAGKARILVGFPPAGGADIVARLIANEMKSYASAIIIENRPGGGGRIALDILKGSAADGSVMALTPASLIVLFPHVYKSLNYDPSRDFIPVTSVCTFPYLLTVGPMVPPQVKTVADFIGWCRANPDASDLRHAWQRIAAAFHRGSAVANRRLRVSACALSGRGAGAAGPAGRPDRGVHRDDGRDAAANPVAVRATARAGDDEPATKRSCCPTCRRSRKQAIPHSRSSSGTACSSRPRRLQKPSAGSTVPFVKH